MTASPATPRKRPRAAAPARPSIRALSPTACTALLRRNAVGRIAVCFHDRVDIEPIHYVFDGAWIFGRTSPGTKLTTIEHSPWVAFEVDEARGVFDWKSVVVHGTLYRMAPDGSPAEARAWTRGVAMLRRIVPETGTEDDPVPFRTVLFGIHVDSLTGRTASPRSRPTAR